MILRTRKLPKAGDITIKKVFAFKPANTLEEDGTQHTIWLRFYYVKTEWFEEYNPLLGEKQLFWIKTRSVNKPKEKLKLTVVDIDGKT